MRRALCVVLALETLALAEAPPPSLATIPEGKQLDAALVALVQDPAVGPSDPEARPAAQALLSEGLRQLHAQAFDQALANFLAAYDKFPSPKILLDIAATLYEMGRLAEAANTYNRYLVDPASGSQLVGEVKEILEKLDARLALIAVRVFPRNSQLSIDGGTFIPVGSSFETRVRPGIHLLRIHHGEQAGELSINAFEGERKDVTLAVQLQVTDVEPPPPPAPTSDEPPPTQGWLVVGTQWGTSDALSSRRAYRIADVEVAPRLPPPPPRIEERLAREPEARLEAGVLALVRVDGQQRGFAGGVGLFVAPHPRIELEMSVLRSGLWGAYAGARYRLSTGSIRPLVGGGLPIFLWKDDAMATRVATGVRGALGIEVVITRHAIVQLELGFERFFGVDAQIYDPSIIVPSIGVVGTL